MNSVTIVIPTYNYAQWIGDAIESCLSQTVKCDIVVVDDGSTDNTFDIVKTYPINAYIYKQNGGPASARNAGIRYAKTEYIFPLDSDDKILPNMIETCLNDEHDIVTTCLQTFGDYVEYWNLNDHPTLNDFKETNQVHCSALFKKEMWEKIGGYDESLNGYEDWDFWVRASSAGYKFHVMKSYLFLYRQHGDSTNKDAIKNHAKLQKYILSKL